MKISRKDTIIIAVLVNVALVALVFALAVWPKKEKEVAAVRESVPTKEETAIAASGEKAPIDEIDQVLQEYALRQKVVVAEVKEEKTDGPITVTVKKGDVLSKIAKAHNVRLEELMQLNNLESSKLKIGQVLKIPEKKAASVATGEKMPLGVSQEPEYYTIKGGDNPWKVARKFNVKYEDLLSLNNLDEKTAKNLKIGQKIRVR
jgi:LysM repeat protein